MVEIFGGWGRIRTWIDKRIRIKDTGNTFVGEDSGKVATGDNNSFIGYQAGFANISGYNNNFIGCQAGLSNTTGIRNNFIGYRAGYTNNSGYSNNFVGVQAGYANTNGYYNNFIGYNTALSNTTGHSNNFVGYAAGSNNTSGYNNVFLGHQTGYTNIIGHHNVFLGCGAGYYETGNSKLFIDDLPRADEADGRIKALLYGVFAAATANQLLRINGILQLTEIKNGATQVGAGAAANEVWKTNGHATLPDNVLMIGV